MNIWEGVYDEFPNVGHVIHHNIAQPIANDVFHEYPLPVVVAMYEKGFSDDPLPVSILDFGGGTGKMYASIKKLCPDKPLLYTVLELPNQVEEGKKLWAEEKEIIFISSFDEILDVDIVFTGSTFQYVDDWRLCLEQFMEVRPEYIVFGDLLAGDIKPFVTLQQYHGKQIPVRFHNLNEILDALPGYEVVFNSRYKGRICGEYQTLPMDNFPSDRRLSHSRNLILRRR